MGQYKEALTTKDQFNCLGIARQLFLMPGTKNFVGAWQLALDFLGPEFKRPGIYQVFPGPRRDLWERPNVVSYTNGRRGLNYL